MVAVSTAPAPARPTVTEDGKVTFLAAVTGVPDEVDDVIVPGAFARTLRIRKPKIVRSHDWNRLVGRVVEAIELLPGDPRLPRRTADGAPWPREAGGLLVRGQINMATAEGKAALAEITFYGATDAAFSIGYRPTKTRQRGGLREIHDLDLFEVSTGVLHGAHPLARLVDHADPDQLEVKAMPMRARRRVPLGELDLLRHERIRRDVARWERESGDLEPYASTVPATIGTKWTTPGACSECCAARTWSAGRR